MSLVPHNNADPSQQPAITPFHSDIQAAIAQALAAQNEANEAKLKARDEMIDKLMSNLDDVKIDKHTSSGKKSTPQKPTPTKKAPASGALAQPVQSFKVKAPVKVSPAKPTPPRKRPHQVRSDQYPPGFGKTKVEAHHISSYALILILHGCRLRLKHTYGYCGA